jgi:hypothetical protein
MTPQQRKAQAIADLAAGESAQIVAERYGLNPYTVRSWKRRELPRLVSPETTHLAPLHAAPQRTQIGDQILALLVAKLEASAAIARAVSNPQWLAAQSGSDLAALGEWLDSTAFAIGDRLASRKAPGE